MNLEVLILESVSWTLSLEYILILALFPTWPTVQRAPRHAPYTGCRLVLSGGLEWPSAHQRFSAVEQQCCLSCMESLAVKTFLS